MRSYGVAADLGLPNKLPKFNQRRPCVKTALGTSAADNDADDDVGANKSNESVKSDLMAGDSMLSSGRVVDYRVKGADEWNTNNTWIGSRSRLSVSPGTGRLAYSNLPDW